MAEGTRSGGFERPSLLAVDDDPAVLRAVERDLRRRYGGHYRVLRADSGAAAADLLRQLKLRGQPLALAVADQRMPGMSGVELLEEARSLCPSAKRVLLTAYADTEAAIKAINDVGLDYYLLKPLGPARGAAVSGRRRPSGRLDGLGRHRRDRGAARGAPLLARVARPA